jgi:hypothetical protein
METMDVQTQMKRKSSDSLEEVVSGKKKQAVMWSGGKNPVQLLHEKFPVIKYDFQQEGK